MSTSSVQPTYSITSNSSQDTITIEFSDTSSDTITLSHTPYIGFSSTTGTTFNNVTSSGYTVGGITSSGTISINDIISEYEISKEWVNCFPDFDRIQEMCKQYPGLKIAYEKFITTYRLVKDDYDTPKDKRIKP